MGARAQVYIKDNGVYLYTHWGSGRIVEDVQTALTSPAGLARLNDPDYLARIIFDVMTGVDADVETGFGIGTKPMGVLDYLVTVDCQHREVTVTEYRWNDEKREEEAVNHRFDLNQFVNAVTDGWR
jgi:hypothetical protein